MSNSTETEEALEAAETPEAVADGSAEERSTEAAEGADGSAPAEKAEEAEEAEEPDKAEKEEKADKAKKSEKAEKPDKAEKSEELAGGKDRNPARRGLAARLNGGVALVAALVLLVVSLGASAFLWKAHSDVSDELSAQKQVRTRSAEFARAFLLYEKSDLDGWEQRLTALAAPEYRGAIGQAVKLQFPLITSLEASSEVAIRDVFVNEFDGSVAKAMVVADSQVSSKDFLRTATGMRLLVELTRVKGEWLVSGVGMLGIDDETMTDAKGNPVDPSKVEVPEVAPSGTP